MCACMQVCELDVRAFLTATTVGDPQATDAAAEKAKTSKVASFLMEFRIFYMSALDEGGQGDEGQSV